MYEAYLYSQQENLTISSIKNKEYLLDIDISKTQNRCNEHNIHAFIQWTEEYHYKRNHIYNKPHIVYAIGNLNLLNKQILWIVWPRAMSNYGERIVTDLIYQAKDYDLVTISGLAPGIDMTTHTQSIKEWIPTIAILWGGLYYFLKQEAKKKLIHEIVWAWGLVLSEFKLKTIPTTYTFPQRNRIIAWLCDILVVPEAWVKSWSLITVDDALRLHKPVYGFPNTIYSETSKGIHEYIYQKKIHCVSYIPDILTQHFKLHTPIKEETLYQTILWTEEEKILNLRNNINTISIEYIHQQTGYTTPTIMSYLWVLELYWYIKQSWSNKYQRI